MDSAEGSSHDRARWAGWAGCAWAIAYVPIHGFWALTGNTWPIGELPQSVEASWRQTNWAACLVIAGAAVVCLALVQPWGRRLPRGLLLGVAWLGAGFALLHSIAQWAQILMKVTKVSDGTVTTFDRWDLVVFEPWFMVMGCLLALSAVQYARGDDGAGGVRATPLTRSPAALVSAALVLVGALVVLVGVMTFEPWAYAAAGPGLLLAGLVGRLTMRRRTPV